MSQFTWRTSLDGVPIEVLAGWDRPLDTYFVSVFDFDGDLAIEMPSDGDGWQHPGTITYWLGLQRIPYPDCLDEKLSTGRGNTSEILTLDGYHES